MIPQALSNRKNAWFIWSAFRLFVDNESIHLDRTSVLVWQAIWTVHGFIKINVFSLSSPQLRQSPSGPPRPSSPQGTGSSTVPSRHNRVTCLLSSQRTYWYRPRKAELLGESLSNQPKRTDASRACICQLINSFPNPKTLVNSFANPKINYFPYKTNLLLKSQIIFEKWFCLIWIIFYAKHFLYFFLPFICYHFIGFIGTLFCFWCSFQAQTTPHYSCMSNDHTQ